MADDLLNSLENLNLNDASIAAANTTALSGAVYAAYPTPQTISTISKAALTPDGCQSLQLYLSSNNFRAVYNIFIATFESIFDLTTNQFGHHVFGTLIPLCNNQQLYQIATKLAIHPEVLASVAIDRYGSPSIKRFIKQISRLDEAVTVLIEALSIGFFKLMTHKTGNHVVLQCLESLTIPQTNFLYVAAIENALALATDKNGCLAFNQFIAASRGPWRNILLNATCGFSVYLAQDPYGNFVVQYILGLENPLLTNKICYLLRGHYMNMSLLKESSHVVEKCLRSNRRDYAIDEMIQCPKNVLLQVARDRYGNFVIQTALKESRSSSSSRHFALHLRLVENIRGMVQYLQRGYGRNVANLIAQLDAEATAMVKAGGYGNNRTQM